MQDTDPAAGANAGQAEFWNAAPGQKWARHRDRLDALFAEITEMLLARAAIAPGESVLDIGCGAGATTLVAADHAGPSGRVEGVDISETLLGEARARAAGRDTVCFRLADAQTHAFPPGAFDLVLSRFGCMFFADPVAAHANIGRALRPGGRAVLMSWDAAERNPWSHLSRAAAVARLGPVPVDGPRVPGQFAFAELGYVEDILTAAGFTGITSATLDTHLRAGATTAEAAELATLIGPVSRIMAEHGGTEDDRLAIAAELARALSPFAGPGGVSVPARVNLFTATWP
ncbi:class I SAM-dependent methyltransferase [Defluviimonas salinarum]|uniref:Methyltransferase domain-containing protein n=1 Tax=Defluviimonas salinarum TaxID=2992147 RepID=A0ABT3J8E5_9RHOB|nr:methyltransferase domain-containing protein [Defluviimonas salinarum]MCW3783941.1 methyltransferase domain-containing protein [Defluviimonas salinarum]